MKNFKITPFYFFLVVLALFTSCENEDPNTNTGDSSSNDASFEYIDLGDYLKSGNKTIFINENEGWQVGISVDNPILFDPLETLLYTDDGGSSWTVQNSAMNIDQYLLKFINSTDGYLIDDDSWAKYTTDKGVTWTDVSIANPDNDRIDFYATASNSTTTVMLAWLNTSSSVLYFIPNSTMSTPLQHLVTKFVSLPEMKYPGHTMYLSENGDINIAPVQREGNDYREIAYSEDDGATWSYTKIESEGDVQTLPRVSDMSFPDDNTGYFTARDDGYAKAYFYKTTDGGSTWTKKSISSVTTGYNLNQISFADANNGLGTGMADLFKTTDGGETWTELSFFGDNYISTFSVSYPVQDHGFINALNGADDDYSERIYKYTGQ